MSARPTTTPGGVAWGRFVAVATPAALAALLMIPAILFGWITLTISSAEPIGVSTSAGTADDLTVVAGSSGNVVSLAPAGVDGVAPMLELSDTHLEDLCLAPRLRAPLVGDLISLRVTSSHPVDIGRITLASSSARTGHLSLPPTTLGYRSASDVAGAPHQRALTLDTGTGREPAALEDAELAVYGLVLEDGISLSSIGFGASRGELPC